MAARPYLFDHGGASRPSDRTFIALGLLALNTCRRSTRRSGVMFTQVPM